MSECSNRQYVVNLITRSLSFFLEGGEVEKGNILNLGEGKIPEFRVNGFVKS